MISVNSLLDSIHGGLGHEGMVPLDQQYQLFASAGAIKFPTPESEAWKEKVMKIEMSLWPKSLPCTLFLTVQIFPCTDQEVVFIAYGEGICYGCAIEPRS